MKGIILLLMAVGIVGCTAKNAAEKHAWYFSQHRSGTLNGNFTTNRSEDYRLNLPQFKEVYEEGKKDRASGKNRDYASTYAATLRKEADKTQKVNSTFANNVSDTWQDAAEKKDAVLWFNELAATYLDGYNGVM